MSNHIEGKVRNILKENIKTSANFDEIGIEQSLADIGFNSVDFIKVIVGLETEFEFELGDYDLNFDNFDSIQKIIEFVESKSLENGV